MIVAISHVKVSNGYRFIACQKRLSIVTLSPNKLSGSHRLIVCQKHLTVVALPSYQSA